MKASLLKRRMALRKAGPQPEFEPTRVREAFDRNALFDRDRGRCICGADTVAQRQEFKDALDHLEREDILRKYGIPRHRASGEWYDGHHRVPVIEGGSSDLSNIDTVCLLCHAKLSAELAAKKAKALRVAAKFNPEYQTKQPHAEEVL